MVSWRITHELFTGSNNRMVAPTYGANCEANFEGFVFIFKLSWYLIVYEDLQLLYRMITQWTYQTDHIRRDNATIGLTPPAVPVPS